MSETFADLELDDEHVTIGLDDTLVEGCKRLVSIPSGILVVLDDEETSQRCHWSTTDAQSDWKRRRCECYNMQEVMGMDVLKVALSDSIADVIKSVNERMPQAESQRRLRCI